MPVSYDNITTITLDAGAGCYIAHVVTDAIRIATVLQREVEFVFNQLTVRVAPNDAVNAVIERWERLRKEHKYAS